MGNRRCATSGTPTYFQKAGKTCRLHLLGVAGAVILAAVSVLLAGEPVQVPVISGNLGPCSADFTVADSTNKPMYDAKIHVIILYGFLNKRKTELEVGTNSDGKARVEGLPSKVKRPLEFQIRHGEQTKSVMHDPSVTCQANFDVVLGK